MYGTDVQSLFPIVQWAAQSYSGRDVCHTVT